MDLPPLDPLRRVGRQHMLAATARLAAGRLPTLLAQVLRLAPHTIAGGWLGAVVAVLSEMSPQVLHLGQQRAHLLAQDGDLFFWRQITSLPDKASPVLNCYTLKIQLLHQFLLRYLAEHRERRSTPLPMFS